MRKLYILISSPILILLASSFAYTSYDTYKNNASNTVVITGYIDSTCSNNDGRTLELYVDGNVDLSGWSVNVQNNGSGFTNSIDLTSLGVINDAFVYITNNAAVLNSEFGISTNIIVDSSIESDGDEAFQVVDNTLSVIDKFGVENVDGTNTDWEHSDSFFYRQNGVVSNNGNFDTSNWNFGDLNLLDNEGLCNSGNPFSELVLFGSYSVNPTTKVQFIHNSADPNLNLIDIYVDGNLEVDDIAFRNATAFLDINVGTQIDIDVAPSNSSSSNDSFYTLTTDLEQNDNYIIIANGVQNPSNFDASVNSPIDFELSVFPNAREEALAISGNTDILFHHASTDLSTVDIVETTIPVGTVVSNLSYLDFFGYIQIATSNYRLEVKSQDGVSLINTYDAPLSGLNLQNQAVTILASGFLDPSINQNGDDFGLWLATPDGGSLIELPLLSSCSAETAPYVESFESSEWQNGSGIQNINDQIDECWERIPENDGSSYTWSVTSGSTSSGGTGPDDGFDGGKYVYSEASTGSDGDEAEFKTPLIDISSLTNPALEFSYFMFGPDINQLKVEAKNADDNSWVQLFSVIGQQQQSEAEDWITQELDLSGLSSNVIEIRFIATRGPGFQADIAIDSIKVQELTTCDEPNNLIASSIGEDNVTLSWDNILEASSGYNWFVYLAGEDPSTSTPIANGSTAASVTNINVTGLQASTEYDAYVEADCGTDGLSNLSDVETFTTNACSASEQCDYTFTLSSNFGGGWFGSSFDVIQDGITVATLGPSFTTGSTLDVIVSLCENSNIELFWNNGGFETNVGISVTNPFGDEIFDKPFGTGSPGTTVFTFTANCTPPACPKPDNLTVNIQSATSVDLNWDSVNEATNGYQWQIFNSGDDPQVSTPVDTGTTAVGVTNVIVTNLTANTAYDAYVIADCDTDGLSDLSTQATFLTPCSTIIAPWNENFDSAEWVEGTGFQNENDQISQCWSRTPDNLGGAYSWGTGSGSTSSANTGPGDDISGGGNYIYAESSGSSQGDQAIITSPLIDISGLNDPFLIYNIFLFGNINSIAVEVKEVNSTTWTEIASFTAQIQAAEFDEWSEENFDLGAFANQTIQVRFVALSSGSFNGDMAVDNVSIVEAPDCLKPTGLTVSNIGETTADLNWNPNSTATDGFNYEIYLEGDGPITSTPVTSGSVGASVNTVSVSGLSAFTSYEAYVQSDCGATEGLSDFSQPVQFSTIACEASDACSYEFVLTDTFGDGWNGAEIDVIQNSIVVATLGPNFTTGNQATVNISLCDDTTIELFWSNGGTFSNEVGLSVTDPFGDNFYNLNPGTETPNASLTTFTAECDPPAGCFPPTNVSTTNLTPTSADLTWTQFVNAFGGYDWFLFFAGSNPLSTTPVDSGTAASSDTQATLSNLTQATSYDVYIRSDCGIVGVSDLAGPVTFTTPCEVFTSPYTENFDDNTWIEGAGFQNSGDQINTCWSRTPDNTGSNFFWGVGEGDQPSSITGPSQDFTGGNYIYSVSNLGTSGSTAIFKSPEIDLTNLSIPTVQFKYFMFGQDINQLEIQVKQTTQSSWTSVLVLSGEQQTSANDFWKTEFIDISSFSNQIIEVRFIATRGSSSISEIAIDDFRIDELPSCLTPEDFAVNSVTESSADFDWSIISNASDGYQVEVYLEGDDPDTTSPVASSTVASDVTSTTVTGLTNSTSYKAYVFADCGPTDGLSELSIPVFFVTEGCSVSNQCDYTFELEDSFGDGWNGNTIDVIQNGITIQTLGNNFTNGSNQTITVPICDASSIELYWNPGGSFANEISLTLTNPFGQEIFNKPAGTGNPDSSLFTFTASCTPPPCDIPSNFIATNIQEDSVVLSWDESVNASQGYDWFVFLAGDDPQSDSPVTSGSNAFGVNQVSITGLSDGTDYEAYIKADCGFDESALSDALQFTTLSICPVPTNLEVTNIQNTTVDLSWDTVVDAVNGYNWLVFNAGDNPLNDTPVASGTVNASTTSVSVSGLTVDSDYEAYIQADCNFDLSDLSSLVSFTTTSICEIPQNISVGNIQQTTAELNWDEVADATNGYSWFVYLAGDDPQTATPVANGVINFGTNTVSISNLNPGTDYEAYVLSDCGFDASDLSMAFAFTTLPDNSPVNDDICNAITLGVNDSSSPSQYSNVDATTQANEPVPPCFVDGISNTVWFDFVAPSQGSVTITTDFTGSSLTDSEFAVYQSSSTCDDFTALVEIACATDGGSSNSDSAELLLDNLNPGDTYYIQVDSGSNSAAGDFGIEVNTSLSDVTFSKTNFKYYPNPVSTTLTIDSANPIESVKVFNILGK
ncbi:fibronectin type III domain-containing protein, partial [Flavobacteriaceae bacterium 14752]|uniref:fibronectin type III domain-containing protein n=1 Tax=Mesohalobacter salilacus TaxID=2491711 RepID=UPI000F63ECDD